MAQGGDVRLAALNATHWEQVYAIYAAGIETGHATFSDTPPTWAQFDREKLPILRTVALDGDGRVLGWVACSPTNTRLVYVGVLEVSIYVSPEARERGIGGKLLRNTVRESEDAGFWTLQSAVFPENAASIRLHESAGFRVIGTRERVGKMTHGPMAGVWRDTVLLERRSPVVGS
ncbi:GNAT family N-acetyltransferase [Serinibacter salmoneus]|uniref:Phosphinothricin acetyltransferase n=1 Tax=Serinibacter salmoneus TaxID=556530 RepID=A0A2A9CYF4_9MICO|nr:GNAT family N-acetyltransferase [Serinibacter salmoneus]PFG19166.1 phosphinothricin acetyltransferase [Serinibacter salmoneus]